MTPNFSSIKAPSMTLLRAFCKPSTCSSCQVRAAHSYMPRSKYAKITSLDKLHRKQKKDLRQERLNSEIRAKAMRAPSYALVATASTSATPPADAPASTAPSITYPEQPVIKRRRTKSAMEDDIGFAHELSGDTQPLTDVPTAPSLSPVVPPPQQAIAAAVPNITPQPLPYFIKRTPSQELPVYQKTKSGGSKHITTVRKLSGDLGIMKNHLLDALALEPKFVDRLGRKKENVQINHRTQQIIVRGWRGPEIKQWAQMVGF